MVPGRDRTRDPWICSQTGICSQTRYQLHYAARYRLVWTCVVHHPLKTVFFRVKAHIVFHVKEVSKAFLIIPRRSRRGIVLASSVRPSVQSVRPSGAISQYLLVRFDSFLVQMISTMDSQTSNKFGQNQPLHT